MTNKTLAIIKPDAVKRNLIGKIISIIEENDFVVSQIKSYHLNTVEAETFYEIHKGKSFFEALIDYMTSGKIIVLLLHKNNAVSQFRKLIGNTNPELANSGTIRKLYAVNQTQNSIHGSDSDINANVEINFFFK
jgi:nucleoside-diphosphate kinase